MWWRRASSSPRRRPPCSARRTIVVASATASSRVRMKAPPPTLTSKTMADAPPAIFFETIEAAIRPTPMNMPMVIVPTTLIPLAGLTMLILPRIKGAVIGLLYALKVRRGDAALHTADRFE